MPPPFPYVYLFAQNKIGLSDLVDVGYLGSEDLKCQHSRSTARHTQLMRFVSAAIEDASHLGFSTLIEVRQRRVALSLHQLTLCRPAIRKSARLLCDQRSC